MNNMCFKNFFQGLRIPDVCLVKLEIDAPQVQDLGLQSLNSVNGFGIAVAKVIHADDLKSSS